MTAGLIRHQGASQPGIIHRISTVANTIKWVECRSAGPQAGIKTVSAQLTGWLNPLSGAARWQCGRHVVARLLAAGVRWHERGAYGGEPYGDH